MESGTINQPFFTIVIPTKGRPSFLADAIRSVLYQNFCDYELVISDNFNDERTKQTINLFLNHPQVKYFRTRSELNMPEHWEFASRKASGKYVLVLSDRAVLIRHTLSTLHAVLLANPEIAVCSWRWSSFDEQRGIRLGGIPESPIENAELLKTICVAQDFAKRDKKINYELPRGMNSLHRADLAEHIRRKHGALFLPICPDYTSAFLLLSYTDNILHINKPLVLFQGESVSNGRKAVSSVGSWLCYLKTTGMADYYRHVPIKAPIVENIIFNDFLMCKRMTNQKLNCVEIDWVQYFVACYLEILTKVGARISSKNEIEQLMDAWKVALHLFDKNTQHAVNLRIRKMRIIGIKCRALLRRSLMGSFLIYLKQCIEFMKTGNQQARYNSAIEAAGYHNIHSKS